MNKTPTSLVPLLLIAAALLLPRLGYGADYPPRVAQLVANTKKTIQTIDIAAFKKMYDKKTYGLLVDVRDADEYATAHIPGAVNVSRGKLEFTIWKHVGGAEKPNYNQKMMLYCSSSLRTALAAKTLKELGFKNVTAVEMKFADWENAGYPLEANE